SGLELLGRCGMQDARPGRDLGLAPPGYGLSPNSGLELLAIRGAQARWDSPNAGSTPAHYPARFGSPKSCNVVQAPGFATLWRGLDAGGLTSISSTLARKAHLSAASSTSLLVGLPAP